MNTPSPKNTKLRLTWKEACDVLGCKKSMLYRLVEKGELSAYGVGKRNRWYKLNECENYLARSQR